VDIITLALNMFSQGVNPKLDFSNINRVTSVYKRCTDLPVHPRHPYAGDLVYTAFSGSHQDAISKGMDAVAEDATGIWAVPYLPIDPEDVGRSYESIICINSQSGKGGAAYIMDRQFGYKLPKNMQPGFGRVVQAESEKVGDELSSKAVYDVFEREYLREDGYYRLKAFNVVKRHIDRHEEISSAVIEAVMIIGDKEQNLQGKGNGPLDAMCAALNEQTALDFTLNSYDEHSLTKGASSKAVTYIELLDRRENGSREGWWGAGEDTDIIVSSVKALLSAVNRMQAGR
jgi:2-isopropylmalate synthase